MSGEYPLSQRDMRPLENRADRDGKRLAAVLALVDARTGALALKLGNAVAHDATAGAYRAGWPQDAFQVLARFVFVGVDRVSQIELGHDVFSSIGRILHHEPWYVNRIVPERADHAALEDRPEALNRIRVDCAVDILAQAVLDEEASILMQGRLCTVVHNLAVFA